MAHTDLQWAPAALGEKLPNGAIIGGFDLRGTEFYIARAVTEVGTIPGKADPDMECCVVHDFKERTASRFEVLTGSVDRCTWVAVKRNEEDDITIPPNAIQGGSFASGEPLYVARAWFKGGNHPGYVSPGLKKGVQFSYNNGAEYEASYEILVELPAGHVAPGAEVSAAQELDQVLNVWPEKLEAGQTYAVIDANWWHQWRRYSKMTVFNTEDYKNFVRGARPSLPMKNADLLEAQTGTVNEFLLPIQRLQANLVENKHFALVPRAAYDLLIKWYGPADVNIYRDVRATGGSIDLYPNQASFLMANADGTPNLDTLTNLRLSGDMKLQELVTRLGVLISSGSDSGAVLNGASINKAQVEPEAVPAQPVSNSGDKRFPGTSSATHSTAASYSSIATLNAPPSPPPTPPPVRLWWCEIHANPVEAHGNVPRPDVVPDTSNAKTPADLLALGRWYRLSDNLVNNYTVATMFEKKVAQFGKPDVPRVLCFMLEPVQQQADVKTCLVEQNAVERFKNTAELLPIGEVFDVMDKEKKVFEAMVAECTESEVTFHFLGWLRRYDEKFQRDTASFNSRVFDRNTATQGPRVEPVKPTSVTASHHWGSSSSGSAWDRSVPGAPPVPGAVGLVNIGNTCFMNTSLACLSNIPKLVDFFKEDKYIPFLNRESRLGWGGECAEAFADLMKAFWAGKHKAVVPDKFKRAVGKWKKRFEGFEQQDSSELLSELIDGLHEDVNEVRVRVPTTNPEAGNRNDNEVALEAWKVHAKRHKSFVSDLFLGQMRSRVQCPDCSRISVTFDAFMMLTLTLPEIRDTQQEVYMVPPNGTQPVTKYGLKLDKLGVVHSFRKAIAELLPPLNPSRVILASIMFNHVHNFYGDEFALNRLYSDQLYAYEIQPDVYLPQPAEPPLLTYKEPPPPISRPVSQANLLTPTAANDGGSRPQSRAPGDASDADVPSAVPAPSPRQLGAQPGLLRAEDWHPAAVTSRNKAGRAFGLPILIPIYFRGEPSTFNQLHWAIFNTMKPFMRNPPPLVEVPDTEGGDPTYRLPNPLPYSVHMTDKPTRQCYYHPYTQCRGCELPQTDEPLGLPALEKYSSTGRPLIDIAFYLTWTDPDRDYLDSRAAPANYVVHPSAAKHAYNGPRKVPAIDIADCFDAFVKPEKLGVGNEWYCNVCKGHKEASKEMNFWRLPEILVINLKRFVFNSMYREKIDTLVKFPLENLNLAPWLGNDEYGADGGRLYDLFAVSNHSGGLAGGHYTAYVKNRTDGQWYCHNDSSVYRVEQSEVVSNQAYVLFYQLKSRGAASRLASRAVSPAATMAPAESGAAGNFLTVPGSR